MAAKKRKKELVDESAGFGLNLGALLQVKGGSKDSGASDTPEEKTDEAEAGSFQPLDLSSCGKLVVRAERKGRKGKTVTVILGLGGQPEQLEMLAKTMRRALGCGGGVEDGDQLVLQGELLDRTQAWLEKNGATNVVLGARPKK